MAGMHGDLFSEIGKLVVAAHGGQPIDLIDTSEDLAQRYANLRLPADAIARAIARSLGAVGLSMALVDARKEAEADLGEAPFAGVDKRSARRTRRSRAAGNVRLRAAPLGRAPRRALLRRGEAVSRRFRRP